MNNLRYKGYSIILQEIPNEITLSINICGCPYKCKGCHSSYLWDNDGQELKIEDVKGLLDKYSFALTCVCFMGGDWEIEELKKIKSVIGNYGLKTAIYSGSDRLETLITLRELYFDYIKIGSYQEKLGGLDKKETNQRMYKLENGKYIDVTKQFQRNQMKE